MTPSVALLLGALEGLTEFLPVSSTGHLILASHWLGLKGEAVKTFEVVIQAGAMIAVIGLYRHSVVAMVRGLFGKDRAGYRLLGLLLRSFLPAAICGIATHRWIKEWLFKPSAVAFALALGGFLMIWVDSRGHRKNRAAATSLESVTPRQAWLIGFAQCFSLWPGVSRAMATVVAGILGGLSPKAAAEYSFLLALPTLGAACVFDWVIGGASLWQDIGGLSILCGFAAAAIVAVFAIKSFVYSIARWGLSVFGWYRLGLALLVLRLSA